MISIACRSANHVIGYKGTIPWSCPYDQDFFKRATIGQTVIMGRRTFESLPSDLPDRKMIVLTRDPQKLKERYPKSKAEFVDELVFPNAGENLFVIGGSSLYELYGPYIDEMILSTIYIDDVQGDRFMAPSGNGYIMELLDKTDVNVNYLNTEGERVSAKAGYDIIRYKFNHA